MKAVIIFSGGQDSTTCLLLAIQQYGPQEVMAITFLYGQRHDIEIEKACEITKSLGVRHEIFDASLLKSITHNAMMENIPIETGGCYPNTFVDGRNALFFLLAAIYAKSLNCPRLIAGISETDYSGYPDCREEFVASMQASLGLAMDYPFILETPLMHLNKSEIWQLADELGYLDFVQKKTHTCYLGIEGGCHTCPACILREAGWEKYIQRRK